LTGNTNTVTYVVIAVLILLAGVAAAAVSELKWKCVLLTSLHSQLGTESNNNVLRSTQNILVVLRTFMALTNVRVMEEVIN
jgi:hypothetical protein